MTAGIRILNTLYVLYVVCSAICYNKATITHHSLQEMTFKQFDSVCVRGESSPQVYGCTEVFKQHITYTLPLI